MRKQYHFRASEQGLLAWDVHRLVVLAEGLPTVAVPLSGIREIDEAYWFSHDAPTCRALLAHMKLVEECDLSYPVLLCAEGRVMDGMHRVVKALSLGHETIGARRFAITPEPDHVGREPQELY